MENTTRQKNVCNKHGITQAELDDGVNQFCKHAAGKFVGDTNVLLAIVDLLGCGDIAEPEPKGVR